MTKDLEQAFEEFADAVEARLATMTETLERAAAENRALRAVVDGLMTRETPTPPAPEPGAPGKDGKDGKDGEPGKDGRDGVDGKDGVGTKEEIESIVERAVTNYQTRTLADLFRGGFISGQQYERGAVVQWDGQPWLSMEDQNGAQPGTSPAWRLLVRKGRDGRDRK